MRADAVELLAPEFGMAFLDRGEPAVDIFQARIGFSIGKRTIERGAVDLALQIGAVTRCGFTVRHCETVGRSGAVCKAVRLLAALARERRPLGAIINDRECGSGLSERAGTGSAPTGGVSVRGGGAVQLALHSARAQRGGVEGDDRCAAPGRDGALARRPQR